MAPPGTRSEPQCAQPARTSTRVFRSQTSLCRLASTLASESALCEPLHGRVCTRSSIYSIVILSVRVRPCGRHVYSTQCRHFATSHELWESGAYFHKVVGVLTGRFGLSRFKSHADCCSPEALLGLLRRTETDLHHSNAAYRACDLARSRNFYNTVTDRLHEINDP